MPKFDFKAYNKINDITNSYIYNIFNNSDIASFNAFLAYTSEIYNFNKLKDNEDRFYYKYKVSIDGRQRKAEMCIPYFKRTLKIRDEFFDTYNTSKLNLDKDIFTTLDKINSTIIEKRFTEEGTVNPKYVKKYHNLDDPITKIYLDTCINKEYKFNIYRNGIVMIKPLGKLDRLGIFNIVTTHFCIGTTDGIIITDEYIVPNRLIK